MTVDVTLASAGTGKTSFVVDQVVAAIEQGVAPERILATTFTISAAAELLERCRVRLLAKGNATAANRLLQARIGTTHSVCGRIAEEFAFELGLSPSMRVVSDEAAAKLFATAADPVVARFADRLNPLAEVFGLEPGRWRDYVRSIVDLARANMIEAADFSISVERSLDGLLTLLPTSMGASANLDEALSTAIERTLGTIEGVELGQDARELVKALLVARACCRSETKVPWPIWAALAKAKTANADADHFVELAQAAAAHPHHPRLRVDVESFVRLVFACAEGALEAYQSLKTAGGLVDFSDQERLALDALRRDDVRACLREDIEFVFVDELQDAAPLEIDIFVELADVAPSSLWVGDLKQQIFSFRGGDAFTVKDAVDAELAKSRRPLGILAKSRRARPALCAFINDVFGPLFATGLDAASSRFTGFENDADPIARDSLNVWFVAGRNRAERADRLAGGIVETLAQPTAWPVRTATGIRPLAASDVAILCRLNVEVDAIAAALAQAGVPVSIERDDLMQRPEAEVVCAALRWIADANDRLALVELVRLTGGEEAQDRWLDALAADDPDAALLALLPFGGVLETIRLQRSAASPLELLDAVLLETGLLDIFARWGELAARLEVIDSLRGRAGAYVDASRREGTPATLNGLIEGLAFGNRMASRSHAGGGVTVTTYHRAKGAEWALTVLWSLESDLPSKIGGPVVETCRSGPTAAESTTRWIRFWPQPYGTRTAGVPLAAAMRSSTAGIRAIEDARAEAVRLLYVGLTRARDYLVLTSTSTPSAWLQKLDIDESEPRLKLPNFENRPILVDGRQHRTAFKLLKTKPAHLPSTSAVYLPEQRSRRTQAPLWIRPSAATGSSSVRECSLGSRFELVGRPGMTSVGEACHAFLAVDAPSAVDRLGQAATALERWGVAANLVPGDLVAAADRLWSFLDGRFGGYRWRREVPIFAKLGDRLVSGRVDLFGKSDAGFVIVDHKAFPGAAADARDRAEKAARQLEAYAHAVAVATGLKCVALLVHLPIVGKVMEVVDIPSR